MSSGSIASKWWLPQAYSTTITNSTDAAKTILQRGIISQPGMYFIQLACQTTQAGAVSTYHVRYYNDAYYVTPIFEGTGLQAPRINSSGALGLNGATPNNTIIKICVQPVLFQ